MSASLGSRRRGRLRDGSCSGGFGPRRRRRRSGLVSVEEEEEDDDDADACCLKNPYWDPSSPAANSTADPTLPAHAGVAVERTWCWLSLGRTPLLRYGRTGRMRRRTPWACAQVREATLAALVGIVEGGRGYSFSWVRRPPAPDCEHASL
uniref:Predicted protein n=1 Tax=Hordeum vulgare subsp. vulgare TaxID=112509 RepID=F2E1J9_HORVV|nr:predicted protein [Hordeum vulgare subsp. vulgare]